MSGVCACGAPKRSTRARCHRCVANDANAKMRTNACLDCGAAILPRSRRCARCAAAANMKAATYCCDCGVKVRQAQRCRACHLASVASGFHTPRTDAPKQRRCGGCGTMTLLDGAFCWNCRSVGALQRDPLPGLVRRNPSGIEAYCAAENVMLRQMREAGL